MNVPTLLAELSAVGLDFLPLAKRLPAYGQAQQVRWAGHSHIHCRQPLDDPFSRPDTTVALLTSEPRQQASDEVLVTVGFEHKRRGVVLSLARMNRAELDVQHAIVLIAAEVFTSRCTASSCRVSKASANRYYSVQLIDLYTHNLVYLGTRTTGNKGGKFLIAGPGWKGEKPDGVDQVIRTETSIVYARYRTQLFSEQDIGRVKEIQAAYAVQPLSIFSGKAVVPPKSVKWPKPVEGMSDSPALIRYLNFLLTFAWYSQPNHDVWAISCSSSRTALLTLIAKSRSIWSSRSFITSSPIQSASTFRLSAML